MVRMKAKTISLPSQEGEPVWELAEMFPYQGSWSVEDYLHLETNKLIEFTEGSVELLPMPSQSHQFIVIYLFQLLKAFVNAGNLGTVLIAPMRVRLNTNRFREPDVMFIFQENDGRRNEQYWDGADLVMEVVSPDDPQRDTVQKRAEYAAAGIPEYWIVNPLDQTITVLTLEGAEYTAVQVCGRGEMAKSILLTGFEADVSAVFDSPK